jgi:uncharacterized protein YbjT (DUF2867 family)
MKVILTGATGMVGKGVLLECLDHSAVKHVLSIGRSETDIHHAKLTQVIHKDFTDFSSLESEMAGYDACFFCLGVSAGGMSEAEYRRITYDYTLTLAKVLYKLNPDMTFIYVSGQGTNEQGRMMWARVKGATENDLLKMGFKKAIMFRPGAIIPLRGIKSRTNLYQFFYDYFMWLLKLVKRISPDSVTDTTKMGLAMINAHLKGAKKNILEPKDINELAEK